MEARFEPRGPLRGTLRPPPDKSISHRAALLGRDGRGAEPAARLSRLRRHPLDAWPPSRRSGRTSRSSPRPTGPATCEVGGIGLRGAGAGRDRRRQRGDAAAAHARLAGRSGRRRVEPRRRRVDPPPARRPRSPSRCAGWARTSSAATGGCRRSASGRGPARDRVRAAGRQRAGEVLRPARGAAGGGPDDCARAGAHPRPHRADAAAAGAAVTRTPGAITVAPAEALSSGRRTVPATSPRPPSSSSRGRSSPGSEITLEGVGMNPTRIALLGILERMGADVEARRPATRAGASRSASSASAPATLTRTVVSATEVPQRHRRAAARRPAGLLRRGRDRDPRRRGAAAQGVRSHRDGRRGAARARGRDGDAPDGLVVAGTGSCPAARWIPGGSPHGDARCGRGPRLRGGREVAGMEAAGVSYPTFERDLRASDLSLLGG